ncbi:MAG: hypothetical protein CMM01_17180 [Rhodopirellula sp.]|nr:hypothetical protein [Rhodopirellula sp.]
MGCEAVQVRSAKPFAILRRGSSQVRCVTLFNIRSLPLGTDFHEIEKKSRSPSLFESIVRLEF